MPLAKSRWVWSNIKHFMHSPHTKHCTAVEKSLLHQEILNSKISWERQESNLGRLGVKRKPYLCAMPTPMKQDSLPPIPIYYDAALIKELIKEAKRCHLL